MNFIDQKKSFIFFTQNIADIIFNSGLKSGYFLIRLVEKASINVCVYIKKKGEEGVIECEEGTE